MCRLLVLVFLMVVVGCTGEPVSTPADRELPDENAITTDTPIESSAPQEDLPLTYPEKAEVQRLLVRAAELESNGQFEGALAFANQAVAVDPSSPRANEMKARLEELLRRIQPSPAGDETSPSSRIAQRTTP